jgi:hypothetical protein
MNARLRLILCLLFIGSVALVPTGEAVAAPRLDWRSIELNVQQMKVADTTFAWAAVGAAVPRSRRPRGRTRRGDMDT